MTSQNKISTKTIARIAAVQLIYQYQLEKQAPDINLLMQQLIKFYQDERATNKANNSIKVKLSISYFEALVKCVVLKLAQIDKIIMKYLTSEWEITKLPILLLALLRVAICELLYFSHVPQKVIINEFTDIGSDMVNDNEVAFINSILDNIAKNSELQYGS